MKRTIALAFLLILLLVFSGCCGRQNKETVTFQGRTFLKADLSEQTLRWLERYNQLSETEQLSISFIPADLHALLGFGSAEDIPAETE